MQDNKKIKVQKIPKHLICDANDALSSVVNRFVNTNTPLFAYENGNFVGLLTVNNSLYQPRRNLSSIISSCLSTPPSITKDTPVSEILRLMLELKLYVLPVFDDSQEMIGLVEAKTLLQDLINLPVFAETLAGKLSKKPVFTISEKATVGQAFQKFVSKSISRLIVVDEKNKLKGVVTKRNLVPLYLSPSNRQRFSTRNHPVNYSFDVEQIKQDKHPLAPFVTPIIDPLDENIDILVATKKILDSRYNSVVFVNRQKFATKILSVNLILTTVVKLITKKPLLLTIVTNLPTELSSKEIHESSLTLQKLAKWVDKQEKLQFLRLTTDTIYSPEGKPKLFEVSIKVVTDPTNYFAKNEDFTFNKATTEVIRQIKKQVRRKK